MSKIELENIMDDFVNYKYDILICTTIIETGIDIANVNTLIIIDFDGVEEATESFFKSYTKFLLESNNKIITINMNTILAKTYSDFIISNITEEEE